VSEAGGLERFRRLGDEELIRLAAGLDAGAFEVLYERHHALAFSLAARIVGSRDRAQDVVQEAFLNLWREAGRYDPRRGRVRNWLMTMVHNRGIDSLRRLSTRERVQAQAEILLPRSAPSDVTSAQAHARDETQTIRGALQGLPEDQRRVIELAFYGGWTQGEIAEMLKLPLGTVKSRARLGLLKLRDALVSQLQAPP